MLPAHRDSLVNPEGFPRSAPKPKINDQGAYRDVLYAVGDVVSDWDGYGAFLKKEKPEFSPRVLLVSHDMSEIENITLMALGGVIKALNGDPHYLLVNPGNTKKIDEFMERYDPHWLGFNLYTGLTDHAFEWIHGYKLSRAERVFGRRFGDFEEADTALKEAVRENGGGPLMEGSKIVYAPIVIGGHYNNHDYGTSFQRGAEYSVRGKGINLLKDILMGGYSPGIYHDPLSYPNIPLFDRDGFYRDTFEFDALKKYALSPIKSVLTALGCAYRCTYCYIGSLVENQEAAYQGSGVRPPSIIQDRPVDTVVREGMEIRRLDDQYRVRTTAVFDQADISLNNFQWWGEFGERWTNEVGIPLYIQARPAMLAGKQGVERVKMIAKNNLVAGISMAIESGDRNVRRLLLRRMEDNATIVDAIKNVKSFMLPLRTQSITGLPVIRPRREPKESDIGLVDAKGKEYYYDDPLQETLKCLDLVCASGLFSKEDYYWNSLYSPFPGTPLGDYSAAAGFHDGGTDNKERAYMFTSETGLDCFPEHTLAKQEAFHRTANFFAHLLNGKDMMTLFLYSREHFTLENFAEFVEEKHPMFITAKKYTKFGLIPDPTPDMLHDFIAHAYPDDSDAGFKNINLRLIPYYEMLLDGLVLAAKVAERYFREKSGGNEFTLDHLTRVERNHYYDNSYNMAYLPQRFAEFLKPYVHENRECLVYEGSGDQPVEAFDQEVTRSQQ